MLTVKALYTSVPKKFQDIAKIVYIHYIKLKEVYESQNSKHDMYHFLDKSVLFS